MILRFIMTTAILCFGVMSQGQSEQDWGKVRTARFEAFNSFGARLNYRLKRLVSYNTERDLISHCTNMTCKDLPVGAYTYSLQSSATGDEVEDRTLLTLRDQVITVDAIAKEIAPLARRLG